MSSHSVGDVSINIHSEELFGAAYDGRRPSYYSGLLAEVISKGKPGSILDLGAGLGLFVELATAWGLRVIGFEGSDFAVRQAINRLQAIDMRVHDLGDSLPIPDCSVDNVVLNQVIEHIDATRFSKVISESFRVLSPGGMLFVYSPSKKNLKERGEPTHINMLLPSELRDEVRKHGFDIVCMPNHGLWWWPANSFLSNNIARILLRILPHDFVSASANVIARKNS